MEKSCNYKNVLSDALIQVGKNTKRIRLERNFTQQDLSFLADCERATISNIERGNCDNITLKIIIKITIVLKISILDLFKI